MEFCMEGLGGKYKLYIGSESYIFARPSTLESPQSVRLIACRSAAASASTEDGRDAAEEFSKDVDEHVGWLERLIKQTNFH